MRGLGIEGRLQRNAVRGVGKEINAGEEKGVWAEERRELSQRPEEKGTEPAPLRWTKEVAVCVAQS